MRASSASRNTSINLVSTYASSNEVSGPGKVFRNLVRGLEKIGQPYVVNKALACTRHLWVHSDLRALVELPRRGTKNVLGPNLVLLPQDLPTRRTFPNSLYLQPCPFPVSMWQIQGFTQCPLRSWPVGIDTDEFPARAQVPQNAPVLVYFKERSPEELEQVLTALQRCGMDCQVIRYGSYTQSDYLAALQTCSFVVWLGRQESQGIALQEALATNVPILVLDATSLFQQFPPEKPRQLFPSHLESVRTSSAPYFDERCGIKVDSLDHLEESLALMREELHTFTPGEFVRENLSLEKQAREFIGFFEELEATEGTTVQEVNRGAVRPYRPRLSTPLRFQARRIRRKLASYFHCSRG